MLTPITWKQIAGYPSIAFCIKHDRVVEPILLTDAQGAMTWGCTYCAEEEMPQVEATRKEPERPQGYFTGFNYHQVTYWCPERTCSYNTTSKASLDIHTRVMHKASSSEKMKCSEGLCDNDAFDFCAQCESAMCKEHLDWHDMCPTCSANQMWPYA